ncbi:MAG: hypothetical protein HUU37_02820 [Bdellovibrionales bacterium]|nr:hypothetical protein [Bdellovibrionales bacterium]
MNRFVVVLSFLFVACAPQKPDDDPGPVTRKTASGEVGTLRFQWREADGAQMSTERKVVSGREGLVLNAPVTYLGSPPLEVEMTGTLTASASTLPQGARILGDRALISAQSQALTVTVGGAERKLWISFQRISGEVRAVSDLTAPVQVASSLGTWHFVGAWEWEGVDGQWIQWQESATGGFTWPRRRHNLEMFTCDFQARSEDLVPWRDSADYRVVRPDTPDLVRELSRPARAAARARMDQGSRRLWVYAKGAAPERAFTAGMWRQLPRSVKAYRPYTMDMKDAGHPWEPRRGCSSPAFGGAEVAGVFLVQDGEELLPPWAEMREVAWHLGVLADGKMLAPWKEIREPLASWPVRALRTPK